MDLPKNADDTSKPLTGNQPSQEQTPGTAEADALLEKHQKLNTSGLSWDEVAKDDKKGWHEITDMGEGD